MQARHPSRKTRTTFSSGNLGGWVPNPNVIKGLVETYQITPELAARVDRAAWVAGGHPEHLARVIWHESRFNPKAQYGHVNGPPGGRFLSGKATGLIQFTAPAAETLGVTQKAIFEMTALQQMDLVERYLKLVSEGKIGKGAAAGPLDSQYKMALAVFYPGWRDKPPSEMLPAAVAEKNPGITTIGDYVERVLSSAPPPPGPIAVGNASSNESREAISDGMTLGLGILVAGALVYLLG